ncbi:MAG: Eco57I restriction-modification methylase domain-containing protein [Kiritimatiellia bacterium]|nr:Eco57I restriction-modification methylase domain-containing protein [Kiritimatiellia bacterium]
MSEIKVVRPDILDCLANLSSDEVFTPPEVVNRMLDLLPQELFRNPKTKFLDPFTKSGVFLREIVKRLDKGLAAIIPDKEKRIRHIFANQVYGIAITQLTALFSRRSLYCNKDVNNERSAVRDCFKTEGGNIGYHPCRHTWVDGSCKVCGASKKALSQSADVENYAYPFLHDEVFMKQAQELGFDVVIGNPPYQMRDGGNGTSAKPIYHLFVEKAKKLNPKHLCMIIPARWYSGGKGLDDFRESMLTDGHISHLVDYENSADVFSGVDIAGGICYFRWDRDYKGICKVATFAPESAGVVEERRLDEFETFIRHNKSVEIVRKVLRAHHGSYMNERVSSRKPFSLPTNYAPAKQGVPCWFVQKIGLSYAKESDVVDNLNCLNKWKVIVPKAPIAGQTDFSKPVALYYESNTRVAKPGECCTESWIVVASFATQKEALSFKSYLYTKVVRFLILQTVVSQDVTKKNYKFVPDLVKYDGLYDDTRLCMAWGISDEEWQFIDSRIA